MGIFCKRLPPTAMFMAIGRYIGYVHGYRKEGVTSFVPEMFPLPPGENCEAVARTNENRSCPLIPK